jgi:hypothetical protein
VTGRRGSEPAAAKKEIGKNATGVQEDISDLGDFDRLFANSVYSATKAAVRPFARI